MKRYFLPKALGVVLAGMLIMENCMPTVATEQATAVVDIDAGETKNTDESQDSETTSSVEQPESPEGTSTSKNDQDKDNSSNQKGQESGEVGKTEQNSQEDSKTEESSKEESKTEQSSQEDSKAEESSKEESSEEESSKEETSIESTTEEESSSEELSAEEDLTEEITEEETETVTETEEMSPALAVFFATDKDAVLTAPSGLAVTKVSSGSVTLQWNTVTGVEGYRIYRSTSQGSGYSPLALIHTDSNQAAYVDTGCEAGQTYYYKVCALAEYEDGTEKEGPFSDTVTNAVDIEEAALNKSKITLEKGTQELLKIIVVPEYAQAVNDVKWSSDNEGIAAVENGKVTALNVGTAHITATVGDKSASCTVTVIQSLQGIELDRTEAAMEKGKTAALTASFIPEVTTDTPTISWTSSNPEVVKIASLTEDSKQAVIEAVAAGEADITAKSGDKTAICHIRVSTPVTDIKLSEKKVVLLENDDRVDVTISLLPEDTTDTAIVWEAADAALVDCELNGTVLTIKSKGILGDTVITIAAGDKKVTLPVEVAIEKETDDFNADLIPVNAVKIKADLLGDDAESGVKGTINLIIGDAQKSAAELSVDIEPEDATNKEVIWKSSNVKVAAVTPEGVVTATGIGRATITATADNGVSDSVAVVVLPLEEDFEITSQSSVTLYCNDKLPDASGVERTHKITLSASYLQYEYRSSNAEVATVDDTGLVTAQAPGTAVITVLDKASGNYDSMSVTVKNIVEDVKVAREEITVLKGTKSEIFFTVAPQEVSKDCLSTLLFTKDKESSPITIDENWTKGKTSGSVKFTADNAGTAKLIITAGDTYTNSAGKKINVTSVKKEITIKVVSDIDLVSSVKLTGNSKMKSGTEQQLELSVRDKSGNDLILSELPIGFASSDETVAVVDHNGKVAALKGGKAVITAYVMDGSNKRASFNITVEQRPDSIGFDRAVYGVAKAANATATVTLKPIFMPTATSGSCKGVNWYISEVRNADDTKISDDLISDYFAVNNSGTVTVKKPASDGMKAVVRCTSKEFGANEQAVYGEATVLVQSKKVSSVKFTSSNVQVVGLREHELAFTTVFTKGNTSAEYAASSSDTTIAEVAAVEAGVVKMKAHRYGTVTITLCADNMVTANCKVTIYPVEKGSIVPQQSNYLIQQAQYDGTDRVELVFVDSKTKKITIDPTLFSYKSSDPDVVSVDENGVAYANPKSDGKITSKNNQVTITATLKDDPDKRKATTKVTVCQTEQVEQMLVSYYESTTKADADKNNTQGKTLTDNGTSFDWSSSSQSIVLRVRAYGAGNNTIQNPQLSFASSDTNIAVIKSQTKKTFGSGENKYEVWEAVVTVKSAGRFSVSVSAKDQKKYSRKISFAACSGNPILISDGLGTINKNADILKASGDNGKDGIASDQTFTVLPADGKQIKEVSVQYADLKVKKDGKTQNVRLLNNFKVENLGGSKYRLIMEQDQLANAVDGTYTIVLNVALQEKPGFGGTEAVTKSIKTTYKVVSSLPKIDAVRITINSFIRGEAVEIPIKTNETIENVSIAPGMNLANELDIYRQNGIWYAKIKEEKFDTWKKSSTSGKLNVYLKGYATPVAVNLAVTTKETKPVVKQLSVPSVQLNHGVSATTVLVDNKQNVWTDYSIVCKNPESKLRFQAEAQADNKTRIVFMDANMKLSSQGATYTEKVLVSKPEWRSPIEMSLSAKAYNGTAVPTVKFDKSTVTINRNVNEKSVETGVAVSLANVELTQGEWQILDSCRYKTTENKQTIWHQCSEAFRTTYENGRLKVELKNPDSMPNGTYKLTMTKIWDASNDEGLKQPLKTSELTVVVKNAAPAVNVKMSGSLDLVSRTQSTLQGTVTVSNVNSTITGIKLINNGNDGFANKFYCVRKDNTFKIYARSTAVLKAAQTKGSIQITMSDGTVLTKEIAFTPKQSTPKVITPEVQKIYKSASTQTVDFNFNENLENGVRISRILASSVPDGIKVQDSNGHLFVTLSDKTLKSGKYKLTVNVYFKGAQEEKDNELGKPVAKTIYVEVKE
ncbi:MAG: Ig-like domain-containing protein [Lachnospiraceae bacterium]|nr:Ig-like domain-containing protein [Lachnospiraceae bacterium]